MKNIRWHKDDGESPTRHKMKGRQRCPKCFSGREGSQRSIHLLQNTITTSFSQCDGTISSSSSSLWFLWERGIGMSNKTPKEDFWSQLLPRPMPMPDHHFDCACYWRVQCKESVGDRRGWHAYSCQKYPSNCTSRFLFFFFFFFHFSIMMWYTKIIFNEKSGITVLKWHSVVLFLELTQACSCRLVIYWEWLVQLA